MGLHRAEENRLLVVREESAEVGVPLEANPKAVTVTFLVPCDATDPAPTTITTSSTATETPTTYIKFCCVGSELLEFDCSYFFFGGGCKPVL